MRLFLSSFRLGNQPQKLAQLAGNNKQALIIVNACDEFNESDRQVRVRQEVLLLRELGFDSKEIDLRKYFNDSQTQQLLHKTLTEAGLVWVRGGNSFVLRRAMKASGFDVMITELLRCDEIAYGGYSAGACMLSPSLKGIEMVDDPHVVPAGYDPAIVWDGLGLLPYMIVPHYKSILPESEAVDRLVQHYTDHKILFRALTDEDVVIVDGRIGK
ncbi:MAG: Type 1 glutamine amidotransferase-like domain-containing protein [Chitinophagaceae bacterium]